MADRDERRVEACGLKGRYIEIDENVYAELIGGVTLNRELIPSGTRTGNYGADVVQENPGFRGVICFMNITARDVGTSPQVHFGLFVHDGKGNRALVGVSGGFEPTVGRHVCVIYPQSGISTGHDCHWAHPFPLPRKWSIEVAFDGDVNSLTYDIQGLYVV